MRRITLLALLSALPHVAAAQTSWHMTCTDKADRSSAASNIVTTAAKCATAVAGLPPTRRVDGSVLAMTDLSYCTVYRTRSSGVVATRIDPAPILQHLEVDRAVCAGTPPVEPPVTPPVTPPATLGAPQNFRVTGLTGSTGRVECTIAPGTAKIILFRVNQDNSIGSRLATGPACGFSYTKFGTGKYVLKAEDRQGTQQSGRSNVITL